MPTVSLRPSILAALLACACASPLAVPADARSAAPASTLFTFTGRGNGHGVGMPQYGAYGAALRGWSAQRILAYYYRGAAISRIADGAVRVLLSTQRPAVAAVSAGPWQIVDEAAQPNTAVALDPGRTYTLAPQGAGVAIRAGAGSVLAVFPGPVRLQPISPTGVVTVGGRTYRGAMRVLRDGARLDVINVVDLEQYLTGIVPGEMPARWGDRAPAALQAQAIAARSYAVATVKPGQAYDLFPDERSQFYVGVDGEDRRATGAVAATRGQVLTYAGRVIVAYFSSSSGGRTEDVQNVFPAVAPEPYLTSVPDPFDSTSPFHVWGPGDRKVVSGARLGRLLGVGPVVSARVLRRGVSPRVVTMQVVTAAGVRRDVSGRLVRKALGLRDTWFYVRRAASGR
jgi:stage II sporulation protein D